MAGKVERDTLTKALIHYIRDERKFRDINLSREKVAHHLGVSKTLLTKAIHEDMGMTFNMLVNKFRVQYARRLIHSPANADVPLEEIAIRAGFSNRMTMHRAFLQYYGTTPGMVKKNSSQSPPVTLSGSPEGNI